MRADAPRVTPGWLALRGPADRRARAAAAGLAGALAGFLCRRGIGATPARPVRLVDVGAGTGAGAAWLRPRLPLAQEWLLLDHDADLLAQAPPVIDGWAEPMVAELARTGALLHDRPADVLTCQALLDLLRPDDLAALLAPAMVSRAAVLTALSVTGRVRIAPAHADDALVAEAFNAHQRRDGRLGPEAGRRAAGLLRGQGYAVTTVSTPWRLGPSQAGLLDAWLEGRAAAAVEQAPAQAHRVGRWLADRRAAYGRVTAVVEHVDVLGLPPSAPVPAT